MGRPDSYCRGLDFRSAVIRFMILIDARPGLFKKSNANRNGCTLPLRRKTHLHKKTLVIAVLQQNWYHSPAAMRNTEKTNENSANNRILPYGHNGDAHQTKTLEICKKQKTSTCFVLKINRVNNGWAQARNAPTTKRSTRKKQEKTGQENLL